MIVSCELLDENENKLGRNRRQINPVTTEIFGVKKMCGKRLALLRGRDGCAIRSASPALRDAARRMVEPWGIEPQSQECHSRILPLYDGPSRQD